MTVKTHETAQNERLKKFLQQRLTINSNTNEFKYNNIDMLHSNEYANDTSIQGHLIHKYFSWIYKISQLYVNNIITQTDIYFRDYSLFNDSSCFDPRRYIFCLLFPFFIVFFWE